MCFICILLPGITLGTLMISTNIINRNTDNLKNIERRNIIYWI